MFVTLGFWIPNTLIEGHIPWFRDSNPRVPTLGYKGEGLDHRVSLKCLDWSPEVWVPMGPKPRTLNLNLYVSISVSALGVGIAD